MGFADKMRAQEEQAKKEGISSSGGSYFKFVEGKNQFRVLTEPEMIFEKFDPARKKYDICYTDCGYEGGAKFMCYVYDKLSRKIQIAKLPYSIGVKIGDWEEDEEYAFQGFPMPFDIKVKATKAGTKEVEYSTDASMQRAEVPAEILEQLAGMETIEAIIAEMKAEKKKEHMADGSFGREQERKAALKSEMSEARKPAPAGQKKGKMITPPKKGEVLPPLEYPEDEEEVNPEDVPF
jgi:hypothetical protein